MDEWSARLLALGALGAIAAAAVGRELHGRPIVSALQLIELGVLLAFVLWGLTRAVLRPAWFLSYLVIALVAMWEGLELIPTLVNGYVLIALPAFVARCAAVVGVGTAAGLLLIVFRIYDHLDDGERAVTVEELEQDGGAMELA